MKKVLASALTSAMVLGAASSTGFAAANAFSDVPTDHWAYDAVMQLAADNVIDGYGDGTFRGQRNITRYEMAQMVARAMSKTTVVDTNTGKPAPVSNTDKALIDRLAAEFSDELNNLGVRVANLERNADMVKWNGKIEYTYTSTRYKQDGNTDKTNNNDLLYRLEPSAEVNKHWHLNARLDGHADLNKDTTTNVKLVRVYAEGDYKNFNAKLGRQAFYTNEHGLVFDSEFSGANLTFGNQLKVSVLGGRVTKDNISSGIWQSTNIPGGYGNNVLTGEGDPATVVGANLQYDGSKWSAGAGYYVVDSDNFRTDIYGLTGANSGATFYSKNGDEKKANIWSANLGYNFSDKAKVWGSYANNTKADTEDNAWQAEFDYGNYNDAAKKGNWSVYAAYRRMGTNASLFGTYDGIARGIKGWEVGASYAIMKNVGLRAIYADGDAIGNNKIDYRKLFGRVEMFW